MRYPRDPDSPTQVIFTDFSAQCRYYLYIWIPRAKIVVYPLNRSPYTPDISHIGPKKKIFGSQGLIPNPWFGLGGFPGVLPVRPSPPKIWPSYKDSPKGSLCSDKPLRKSRDSYLSFGTLVSCTDSRRL